MMQWQGAVAVCWWHGSRWAKKHFTNLLFWTEISTQIICANLKANMPGNEVAWVKWMLFTRLASHDLWKTGKGRKWFAQGLENSSVLWQIFFLIAFDGDLSKQMKRSWRASSYGQAPCMACAFTFMHGISTLSKAPAEPVLTPLCIFGNLCNTQKRKKSKKLCLAPRQRSVGCMGRVRHGSWTQTQCCVEPCILQVCFTNIAQKHC